MARTIAVARHGLQRSAVLARGVGLLVGDAVDRDRGAVEDRVGRADPGHNDVQVVTGCGE
jgi:hypothetical protein